MTAPRYVQLGRVMKSAKVRGKLAEVANRVAQKVDAEATEGDDMAVRTDGTRPKGRPFSRVAVDAADEWGNAYTQRRRRLGRAAAGR